MEDSQGVRVGSIYKKNMDKSEDITPKGGMTFRPKFFVVIGSAEYGYYIAYVLVNKSINENFIYSKELLDCQYPLRTQDYPGIFTIDPSYLNLSRIREMEVMTLLSEATYCGELIDSDLRLVMQTLKELPVLTNKEKRRYGLL
ncbi:hypothetical protein [Parabacteroides sp.]